jgi:two-component system, LytTR family, response regulator
MSRLRLLIVDDEAPARTLIRKFLENEPDVEIVGEAANGQDALELIHSKSPDLMFLDIQMPEMNGFQLLQSGEPPMPHVIFVTAYDQYAVKAFEVHALDYLLKPFNRARFQAALDHAREEIHNPHKSDFPGKLEKLIQEFEKRAQYLDRWAVHHNDRIIFVPTEEIDWIEAAEKYVQIHAGGSTYLMRESLHVMEEKLDPREFVRVHRSTIINIRRIKEVQRWFQGRHIIILSNGKRFTSGKMYKDRLIQLIQNLP